MMLPTTVIGSYPRPKWLRRSMAEFAAGRIPREQMEEAYNDAVRSVLYDELLAGIDIVSDGEMRRDEMTEFFAKSLDGFRFYGPVRVWGNNYYDKPAVTGAVKYRGPMLVDEFRTLRALTDREIKVPITGPYTIADWSFNEHYDTKDELIMAIARAENQELKALVQAGAAFIQIDEPAMSTHTGDLEIFEEAIAATVRGVKAHTAIHSCYGDFSTMYPDLLDFKVDQFALEFANNDFRTLDLFKEHEYTKELGLGVNDVHIRRVETVEEQARNIERAFEVVPPEKIWVNPDCGLKLLPRPVAYGKMVNMVKAAKMVREKLE